LAVFAVAFAVFPAAAFALFTAAIAVLEAVAGRVAFLGRLTVEAKLWREKGRVEFLAVELWLTDAGLVVLLLAAVRCERDKESAHSYWN
jgi:hypothetical protein